MDNFALAWNIDKSSGILEDLIATNKAIRLFLIDAKIGWICMSKISLSNTEDENLLKWTYSITYNSIKKILNRKMPDDVL